MPVLYPIVKVKPEWLRDPEDMGSKKKFWYLALGEQAGYWLFKYPQAGTGQHWAEKIAAEVAKLVNIQCAKVELAVFGSEQGSVTKAFTGGKRELIHGNQILVRTVYGYDPERKFHQSSHTLANIWRAIDRVFKGNTGASRAKLRLAECLVLDALIGNTDRHHENWGILRKRVGDRWKGSVAPSFDHASSLGRELQDVRRERLLAENRVGEYAEKGRGAIYWSEDDRHGPSPLELVRRAVMSYPDLFLPVGKKFEKLDGKAMKDIVNRIPDGWISSFARKFAVDLLCYNFEQLQELLR